MEETKIIPLNENIKTLVILPQNRLAIKTHPYLFVTDVKISLQNLKDELKKELCFCHKLGDYSCMNCIEIDKAFKKHIGELE